MDPIPRLSFLVLTLLAGCAVPTAAPARPNVLLLCIDDLRPELGCYGAAHMRTPHLDRLAAAGVCFTRHFVQVPTCGASRCSMLTGRYPASRQAIDNGAFGAVPRDSVAHLPGLFRTHGYRTVSIGKVTHTPDGSRRQPGGRGDDEAELPNAWDSFGAPAGRWGTAWAAFFGYSDGSTRRPGRTPALEVGASAETPDVRIADAAIAQLAALRGGGRFFLAVGFYKPHLPHVAPRADFAPYPLAQVGLPVVRQAPSGIDGRTGRHASGELLRNYGGHPAGGLANDDYLRRLRQAYYACVSHVDRQVGRVLAALETHRLADDTVVVVWGDHGYHLGDHGLWGKHTLHDRAVHSTLLIRAPGRGRGRCDTCVQSVDLLPTLAELCGLPVPAAADGRSLVTLLDDPGRRQDRAARSFWRSRGAVGRSVRTERWRYTEWHRDGRLVQRELYDHHADPEETRNVAADHPVPARALAGRLGAAPF